MDDKKITQDFVEFHKDLGLCTAVERNGVICWGKRHAKDYCSKHYWRFKKYSDVNLSIKQIKRCRFINCKNKYYGKNLCQIHYTKYVYAPLNKQKKCKVNDCENKRKFGYIYCAKHRHRLKKYGTLEGNEKKVGMKFNFEKGNTFAKKAIVRKCIVPLCDKDSNNAKIVKGLCKKHYIRWRKYGDYNKVLRNRKPKT